MHEEQTSTVNVDERLRPFLTPEIKLLIERRGRESGSASRRSERNSTWPRSANK